MASRAIAVTLAMLQASCGGGDHPPPPPRAFDDAGTIAAACTPGGPRVICEGDLETTCTSRGEVDEVRDCAESGQVCAGELGCRVCVPRAQGCDGETTRSCNDEGTAWIPGAACDVAAGLHCHPGGCADLCALAREQRSYIGCETFAVPLLNSYLGGAFTFAVVVANPQLGPARVTVTRGAGTVAERTVAPGSLETIVLPWIDLLRGVEGSEVSVQLADGAYRVASDVPVTVYQFNPLDYYLPRDCPPERKGEEADGACFSFTNDASLLLPTHALTGNYVALARATNMLGSGGEGGASPGFVTIVGVDPEPTEVEVRLTAPVIASEDGRVPALARGATHTFTLARGEVVQLVGAPPETCSADTFVEVIGETKVVYCNLGIEHDLSGTEIRASRPVSVLAGHNCTFVPYHRWACDHLEEQMFPIESWGREVVISATEPLRPGEPNLVRVVAAHDGTTIELTPAAIHAPVTLARGQFAELEVREDVRIAASEPIGVAQYLVGQDYAGLGSSGIRAVGDPAMALAIPSEQFRTQYTFLAPSSYPESHLNVIAPTGAVIILDGRRIGGFREVAGTTFSSTRFEIESGVHTMTGSTPFGVLVSGFGTYTSYLYAGGLDFREIAPPF